MAGLGQLRGELAAAARRLGELGFAPYHMGNLTLRLPSPRGRPQRFLATPTAVSKRDVQESWLIVVDDKGQVVEGRKKPFSELSLHLAAYAARPDVHAVVHAHPPAATALGSAGGALDLGAEPEAVVALGPDVPLVPFAMPKSKDADAAVRSLAAKHDALLLQGNGALALGPDLEFAMLRMELLEHAALVQRDARAFGGARKLAEAEVATLLEARKKAGLGPRADDAVVVAVARAVARQLGGAAPADLVQKIVREELDRR